MLKRTVALGVCTVSLMIGISSGRAEENVVIDMSVLDSLGSPSATVSHTKPLFPTVKKKSVKPKTKAHKVKKAKTVKAPKVKVEAPKPEIKAPEVKAEAPKPEVKAPEVKAEAPKPEVKAPEVKAEAPKREVIISQPQASRVSKIGIVTFSAEQSELDEPQKKVIDETLSSFKNPKVNKISIISYNLSGGENVFQNKRISLNRAVNTRSYLLEKGYKNFSIKIINVEADDDRINTVSLTELKK